MVCLGVVPASQHGSARVSQRLDLQQKGGKDFGGSFLEKWGLHLNCDKQQGHWRYEELDVLVCVRYVSVPQFFSVCNREAGKDCDGSFRAEVGPEIECDGQQGLRRYEKLEAPDCIRYVNVPHVFSVCNRKAE